LLKLDKKLRERLDEVLGQLEIFWYQKSRIEYIQDGDRNTRFFHLSTIVRRHVNRIENLEDGNGQWTTDPQALRDLVTNYYKSLCTEEEHSPEEARHPVHPFPQLTSEQVSELNKAYTSCEVGDALKRMHPYKAPGPDGFQALFFQRFWNIVGPNVTDTILGVLNGQSLPPTMNHTHLLLLPKVEHPQTIMQFRPIGLCNVTYKLVTKLS